MIDKRAYKRFKMNALEVNATVMFAGNVKIIDMSVKGVSAESIKLLNIGILSVPPDR